MPITYPPLRRLLISVCSLFVTAIGLTLCGCATGPVDKSKSLVPPEPQREFRAVWVATVANIDWPSKPGLSTQDQQKEIIAILDKCANLKLNAVVLQVRTSCDAFYPSKLEPWSEYLTGTQGKAPEPFYDPLQMWVEEAHRRGIELHAWFNPYRARATAAKGPNAPGHVSNTDPEVVKSFNGYQWLDPAEPAAQDLTYNVFMDVVKRYDIDGVHMDDYFYPYPDYLTDKETKKVSDFPDDPSWARYQKSGGKLSRGDWRRHNVDELVERLYKGIKAAKPHVKFGISPFGIAKPGNPPTVKSTFNQYEKLYADAQLWLHKGWCDYFTPQLYWKVESDQPYRDLLEWWTNENYKGRHIWPGLFTSKYPAPDLLDQIYVTRDTAGATGHVHFSMKPLLRDEDSASPSNDSERRRGRRRQRAADSQPSASATPSTQSTTASTTQPTQRSIAHALATLAYAEPALVPASPWLDNKPPASPKVAVKREGPDDTVIVSWKRSGREKAWLWAVYTRHGAAWRLHVYPSETDNVQLAPDPVLGPVTAVAVRAVDRSGNQSSEARAIAVKPRSKP
jgi:uncharacterized lipoprotein YddW (UPF0748 family)